MIIRVFHLVLYMGRNILFCRPPFYLSLFYDFHIWPPHKSAKSSTFRWFFINILLINSSSYELWHSYVDLAAYSPFVGLELSNNGHFVIIGQVFWTKCLINLIIHYFYGPNFVVMYVCWTLWYAIFFSKKVDGSLPTRQFFIFISSALNIKARKHVYHFL